MTEKEFNFPDIQGSFDQESNKIRKIFKDVSDQFNAIVNQTNVNKSIERKIFEVNSQFDSFKKIADYSVDFEPALFVQEAVDPTTGETLVSIVEHAFKIEIPKIHEAWIPFITYEIVTKLNAGDPTWSVDGQIMYRNDVTIIEELGESFFGGVGSVSTNPIKKATINISLSFLNVKTSDSTYNVPSYEFGLNMKIFNPNVAV